MVNQPLKGKQQSFDTNSARRIILSGQVQGVGFRPFIYRIAKQHNLSGWVRNNVGLVEIYVQGEPLNIDEFLEDIFEKKPTLAKPQLESANTVDSEDCDAFSILKSQSKGQAKISVPVDLFLCDDCLAELNDPLDRRYHYPFINCTQCGPRYTIIQSLPYDRVNTSMKNFDLCPQCLAEYNDPDNRRFHAEPIACPVCGPYLSLQNDATIVDNTEDSLQQTIDLLKQGKVVAIKGIGGYHLMCDANNSQAVNRLRNNKSRPHKPLAVMFPAPLHNPFEFAELSVVLNEDEKSFLLQAARPILLVTKTNNKKLSDQIAPGLNEIGVMLPYSPLHHLLLNGFSGPLVATSANISGEPVMIDNQTIEKRLTHVADAFLHHNRPIERPADDPVFKTIAGKPRPLRLGRGFSPLELSLPVMLNEPVLAVGAHMKNVIALAWDNRIVLSPHIGEMDSVRSLQVFENSIIDLQKLFDVKAKRIICDAHPGYTSTRWAFKQKLPVTSVLHHHAHASAAYYECNTDENVLVFSWDGVGYGENASLFGGETFLGKPGEWKRVASMLPFNIPGGEKAGREPWRSAAALCWQTGQMFDEFSDDQLLLKQAWDKKINTPQTTSVGRLFDAAAALTGVCTHASFEGQGPMMLEAQCDFNSENGEIHSVDYVALPLTESNELLQTDWQPLVNVMQDTRLSVSKRATIFHASLAQALLQQAIKIRRDYKVNKISFSGGVFQNRVLSEYVMRILADHDFEIYMPELIPVNDAGICFGQVLEYAYTQ